MSCMKLYSYSQLSQDWKEGASAEFLLPGRASRNTLINSRLRSFYPVEVKVEAEAEAEAEDELIVVQHTAMQNSWTQQASNGLRATIIPPRQLSPALVFKRALQDVSITRTGKPIIRIQGGR